MCNAYSAVVQIDDQQNVPEIKYEVEAEKLFNLATKDKPNAEDDALTGIENILRRNKSLLHYKLCRGKRIRSVLYMAKYNSEKNNENKKKVIHTLLNIGYELYKFSLENCMVDNFHAYFFTAVKGDYTELSEIINYFKTNDIISKLHDTREGDTVLSFMLKFGNVQHEQFFNCFTLIMNEVKIDYRRVDYFKQNIANLVRQQLNFLQKFSKKGNEINILNNILRFIVENNEIDDSFSINSNKIQLFQSIINSTVNFKTVLKDRRLVDADDGENTLLQLAIIKDNITLAKTLLKQNADPNKIVKGGNEEVPLVLAAKLTREDIFLELLRCKRLEITNEIFGLFIKHNLKFFSYLLESEKVEITFQYKNNSPLYYAIKRSNRKAIQSLLQRGANLDDNCLRNINPKDLEEYLNSCVLLDNYRDHIEDYDYKFLFVFDVFIKSKKNMNPQNETSTISNNEFESEVEIIRKISSTKRLKHLLEHPLIYMFILLKWECVSFYYYCFVLLKLIFYIVVVALVYSAPPNLYIFLIFILLIQMPIVIFNFLELKFEYRRYSLHFIIEILLFIDLFCTFISSAVQNDVNSPVIKQFSAFAIILISVSVLLTLGYHINLSKWTSMIKRVFKTFTLLLLLFINPILAFSIAFNILLPVNSEVKKNVTTENEENRDFTYLPRSVFRVFLMLSGDIGDKNFYLFGSYLIFLFFCVGMAIVLMNFWTGVAVSDIKEIEEQSTIVAFKNVLVFIQSVEKIYHFLFLKLFVKFNKYKLITFFRSKEPFLKTKIALNSRKYSHGIDIYINAVKQIKLKAFEALQIQEDKVLEIKSLKKNPSNEILEELLRRSEILNSQTDTILKRMEKLEKSFENVCKKLKDTVK